MQFYFIRHAQSTNNLLWDLTGSNDNRNEDPPLTALGKQQSQRLADFLLRGNPDGGKISSHSGQSGFGLTHLYTSLMLRAVETGMTVADTLCLPLIVWEDFHEQGGIYLTNEVSGERNGLPGKTRSFFQTYFPGLILPTSLDDTGWWHQRPYETSEQSVLRAQNLLNELLDRHAESNDRVAVISHGGFYNAFLCILLNLPVQNGLWFRLNNSAITRIDFHDDEIRLVYMNRMDYLPSEFIT